MAKYNEILKKLNENDLLLNDNEIYVIKNENEIKLLNYNELKNLNIEIDYDNFIDYKNEFKNDNNFDITNNVIIFKNENEIDKYIEFIKNNDNNEYILYKYDNEFIILNNIDFENILYI